jgi:dihydroxyacetone kinase-like predicted kinase
VPRPQELASTLKDQGSFWEKKVEELTIQLEEVQQQRDQQQVRQQGARAAAARAASPGSRAAWAHRSPAYHPLVASPLRLGCTALHRPPA